MMLTAFVAIASIMFLLLTIIWTKKDWINAMLKMFFAALTIWGVLELVINLGFVVKTV